MNVNSRKPIRTGISFGFELNARPKRDGEYNILFRITENRKHKRIATEISVKRECWDSSKNEIKKADPDSYRKNHLLLNIKTNAVHFLNTIPNVSSEKIYESINGSKLHIQSQCFFLYTETNYLSDKPYNTIRNTITIINKLKSFVKKDNLKFETITTEFIGKFENYLRKECKNNGNTVDTNLTKIKSIINHASKNGIVELNFDPFKTYRIKVYEPTIDKLDQLEIAKIISLDLPEKSLIWHVRNYWLFSYYTAGIRFGDLSCLKWENTFLDSSNKNILVYVMNKNKKVTSIPLHKSALQILKTYKDESSSKSDFIFPILHRNVNMQDEKELMNEISRKNALINKYLKYLSAKAEINKKITFHVARHSFAHIAQQKGINLYDISKSLRHTKISVTEKYLLKLDPTAIDRTMDKMFEEDI